MWTNRARRTVYALSSSVDVNPLQSLGVRARISKNTSCAGSRHNMPRPMQVDL